MSEFKNRSDLALHIIQTSEQSRAAVNLIREIRKTGTSQQFGEELEKTMKLSIKCLLEDIPTDAFVEWNNLTSMFRNRFGDIGYMDIFKAYELHPTRRAAYFANGKSILDHWENTPPMCKLK